MGSYGKILLNDVPEYWEDLSLDSISYRVHSRKGKFGKDNKASKEIICTTTGVKYDSITEAGKILKVPFQNISRVIYKKRKTIRGLKFEFV